MAWLGDTSGAAWLVLAVALGVAEMVSLDLILIMVAVGALVGALAASRRSRSSLQVLLAAGSSAAMLALVRPNLVKKFHQGPDLVTGTTSWSASRASSPRSSPSIIPGGSSWPARSGRPARTTSPDDRPGATVEVFAIRGATAYVHPVGELMP